MDSLCAMYQQHYCVDQTRTDVSLIHPRATKPLTSLPSDTICDTHSLSTSASSSPNLTQDTEVESPTLPILLLGDQETTPSNSRPSSRKYNRKSVPHRSPSAVKDRFQASAMDKSVVFQLDMRPHPFFSSAGMTNPGAIETNTAPKITRRMDKCPDCGLQNCCGISCTSHIICGESIVTALCKRVSESRRRVREREAFYRRGMIQQNAKQPTQKVVHNKIPRAGSQTGSRTRHSLHSSVSDVDCAGNMGHPLWERSTSPSLSSNDSHDEQCQMDASQRLSVGNVTPVHGSVTLPSIPFSISQLVQRIPAAGQAPGRPSRVKSPCQACNEVSDRCMRKAFDWPFPASLFFYDHGRPFVYLCNKCGLRYSKSGGSVCRYCRWVLCKEEKRNAMQIIEAMRQSSPDGRINPEQSIDNFVCTPKYWTCGRPWKVGWVLKDD